MPLKATVQLSTGKKLPQPIQPIRIDLGPVVSAPIPAPPVVPPPVPPKRYLYVPGLARDDLVQNPCLDALAFVTRIGTVFGYRSKRMACGPDHPRRTVGGRGITDYPPEH